MTDKEIERWYLGLPFETACEVETASAGPVSDECVEEVFLDLASIVPA